MLATRSRSAIIHNVWKLSADTMTNVVDVYIKMTCEEKSMPILPTG